MNLQIFNKENLFNSSNNLFEQLGIKLNSSTSENIPIKDVLKNHYKENNTFNSIGNTYFIGIIDDSIFKETGMFDENYSFSDALEQSEINYNGLMLFAIELNKIPTRTEISDITRAFNRVSKKMPVAVLLKYFIDNEAVISFAISERMSYHQSWRAGDKVGKITMLKDIKINKTHSAHLKILSGLSILNQRPPIRSYNDLHKFWQHAFSIQALNEKFYTDLQEWFYFAAQNIELPFKPDYINEKENIKNFLVRLLARIMFCWFVKEKGLIKSELLEIIDWNGRKYLLTNDIDDKNFLFSNSYYRGILQNIFFNALNKKDKKSIKDFKWLKYLNSNFNIEWLLKIPYLNGGIFDKLEEDNTKESIEDSVIKIPNYLFYGIEKEEEIVTGRRRNIKNIKHKGLNCILNDYKFTLDENTPFEEDIALDPEMLGLVFENLLAELDPNLEENTKRSIRKLTGSYYTPRKIIYEMVNDSLFLYLNKFIQEKYKDLPNNKQKINDLIYFNKFEDDDSTFSEAVVDSLDKFKILDPACGSGAFPMGMLNRIVEILKTVDCKNERWINIKLRNVDSAQQNEFKKVLTIHLDDYSRKLGIIRDSIYAIDIQPMAVQITKLRFFISLLIDQKTENIITPMPNIETKIICADSLKNIHSDFFNEEAIKKLTEARNIYYRPDLTQEERNRITDEIVIILNDAFPDFHKDVTGKNQPVRNKELLKKWFKEAAISAPFFNLEFFYPELKEQGGFDCIIGNPPYGGNKVTDDVRNSLDIESKDPYGAFIARFLNNYDKPTPLKHGGVLAFIVSDTFMTIKSHLKLRKHLMQNYIHKMVRVHPDTFRATVNTVIMVAERNTKREFNEEHICLMADLTNISIHENYERFIQILNLTKVDEFDTDKKNISNEQFAIYNFPQSLIKTNSNLPFFVASPKLFSLMNDSGPDLKKEWREISGVKILNRNLKINNKILGIVKLGDVEKIAKGMDSCIKYVFRSDNNVPIIRTHYKIVDKQKIRSKHEITILTEKEKLNGVSEKDFIIPFNKGASSDSSDGWLPNYYVPIEYYIDWSTKAVDEHYHRNKNLYFLDGLTFSFRGEYSPTFRLKNIGPFDANSSFIGTRNFDPIILLGVLCSKFIRYIFNVYIQHTIASDIDKIKEIPIKLTLSNNNILNKMILDIIDKQKSTSRYDYSSYEQIEVDKIIYDEYGLNMEDVQEVENWYARRYPKLVSAQKSNLRALGKSDDYLVLYGLR
ncbi:MAG: hypothetical protein JXA68_03910 [Ignavibacteriales bacterium]|nr:hypothetical protein [Ignavibacteriales bacterium]